MTKQDQRHAWSRARNVSIEFVGIGEHSVPTVATHVAKSCLPGHPMPTVIVCIHAKTTGIECFSHPIVALRVFPHSVCYLHHAGRLLY